MTDPSVPITPVVGLQRPVPAVSRRAFLRRVCAGVGGSAMGGLLVAGGGAAATPTIPATVAPTAAARASTAPAASAAASAAPSAGAAAGGATLVVGGGLGFKSLDP